jgi:hypothetical protein
MKLLEDTKKLSFELDPLSLPSVSMQERKSLPAEIGLYFVISQEVIIYIGRTVNLSQRWKSHHKVDAINVKYPEARIAWLSLGWAELLDVEYDLINRYDPVLNVLRRSSKGLEFKPRSEHGHQGRPQAEPSVNSAGNHFRLHAPGFRKSEKTLIEEFEWRGSLPDGFVSLMPTAHKKGDGTEYRYRISNQEVTEFQLDRLMFAVGILPLECDLNPLLLGISRDEQELIVVTIKSKKAFDKAVAEMKASGEQLKESVLSVKDLDSQSYAMKQLFSYPIF